MSGEVADDLRGSIFVVVEFGGVINNMTVIKS